MDQRVFYRRYEVTRMRIQRQPDCNECEIQHVSKQWAERVRKKIGGLHRRKLASMGAAGCHWRSRLLVFLVGSFTKGASKDILGWLALKERAESRFKEIRKRD